MRYHHYKNLTQLCALPFDYLFVASDIAVENLRIHSVVVEDVGGVYFH